MTHPVERLVDYVDGSLPPEERVVVDAHLRTCARCRQEVTLARGAASALATLPEVQAPDGLGAAAIRRAETDAAERAPEVAALSPRREGHQRTGALAWYRWGGGVAAAAVLVLLVVVALPRLGSAPDTVSTAEDAATEPAAGPVSAARNVEVVDRDYDAAGIVDLAKSYGATRAAPPRPTNLYGPSSPEAAFAGDSVKSSVACLRTGATSLADAGPPVKIIRARFDETPAVIGVYLSGPGADQAADTVTVWVVAAGDCRTILHSTQVRI